MLEYFVEPEFRVLRLRSCAAGEHMDSFADWLQSAGYRRRPGQLLLRGAAHFSEWAAIRSISWSQIDEHVIDGFGLHLATCACTHAFHGRDHYNLEGAKRFVEDLRRRGILSPPEIKHRPLPRLVEAFSDWLRIHRGATEKTITEYVSIIKEFIGNVGEDTAHYDAALVRQFILGKAARIGRSYAQSIASAIRVFLRFLASYKYCSPDLAAAVPRIAHWRLSSLPRYISAERHRTFDCIMQSSDSRRSTRWRDHSSVSAAGPSCG